MIIFALALGSASSASACSSSTVAARRRPSILAICVDLTMLLLCSLGPWEFTAAFSSSGYTFAKETTKYSEYDLKKLGKRERGKEEKSCR